jgi:hypothetical protein
VLPIFALAIFLSAALLFLVEPLAGKIYLPLLGGSPAVWNTCVVFFQAALLLGYLYAHLTTRFLRPRGQAFLHMAFLAGAALLLPIPIAVGEPGTHAPVVWLLAKLALTMGLPFLVISATGPLLQRWFSHTTHAAARDPYFLYAASNAGSALGLLAYPLLLEPLLTRQHQSVAWAIGYGALALIILACVWMTANPSTTTAPNLDQQSSSKTAVPASPSQRLTVSRRLRWTILALVPSSLMLGVTQHISTDLAAVPLLWIIPLLLYLLSFVVAFSQRIKLPAAYWGYMLPFVIVILVMVMLSQARGPLMLLIPQHLLTFFIAATMCHRLLAEDRPDPTHLTEFYFFISLGGVLGGSINALVAPLVFNSILEYPIMLGVACLLRPQVWPAAMRAAGLRTNPATDSQGTGSGRYSAIQLVASVVLAIALLGVLLGIDQAAQRGLLTDNPLVSYLSDIYVLKGRFDPAFFITACRAAIPAVLLAALLPRRGSLRFGLAALALFMGSQWIGSDGSILYRHRSFFGVNTVTTDRFTHTWNALYHGTTQHGVQFKPSPANDPTPRSVMLSLTPNTYYHPKGPIGEVIAMLREGRRFDDCAFIGLGAGTLAAYGSAGTHMTFFEIDPAVVSIATNPSLFTYIADARRDNGADIQLTVADGRLGIAATDRGPFRLIVVDAFSSDAIPVHLLTRDALKVYLSKLKDDGIIAFHTSNRSFYLAPVIARMAGDLGLLTYRRRDALDIISEAKRESEWVVVVHKAQDMGSLAENADWKLYTPKVTDPVWTDDYSNILSVLGGSPP